MEVIYGGGEKCTVVSKVQLGEVEALVVPDIQDSLVSFADFANRGSTIMLTADGGAIANTCNDKQIVLTKDSISGFSLMWLVYDIGSSYQWVFFSDSKKAPIILEI